MALTFHFKNLRGGCLSFAEVPAAVLGGGGRFGGGVGQLGFELGAEVRLGGLGGKAVAAGLDSRHTLNGFHQQRNFVLRLCGVAVEMGDGEVQRFGDDGLFGPDFFRGALRADEIGAIHGAFDAEKLWDSGFIALCDMALEPIS